MPIDDERFATVSAMRVPAHRAPRSGHAGRRIRRPRSREVHSCPMLCGTSLIPRPPVSRWLIGLPARILLAQPGHALRASASPARAQARPAAPAGGLQPGQPGGVRQQLGNAAIARNRDDGPDPAARQRKPLPRPVCCRVTRHGVHDTIFPCSATSSPLSPSPLVRLVHPARAGRASAIKSLASA